MPQDRIKPFIGATVQRRVHGVSFVEALHRLDKSDPHYQELRRNTSKLITGLRNWHEENSYGAFTWHGLESDNVTVEVDDEGKLTGRVFVVDANFTERPNKTFKEVVVKKLERDVFEKLEQALELS